MLKSEEREVGLSEEIRSGCLRIVSPAPLPRISSQLPFLIPRAYHPHAYLLTQTEELIWLKAFSSYAVYMYVVDL